MDVVYLSALSALASSVVGENGLHDVDEPTFAGASEPAHGRLATAPDLVRDFIAATSETYADAAVSSEPKIKELVALWAMVSRMPVLCSPATVSCGLIIDTLSPQRRLQNCMT